MKGTRKRFSSLMADYLQEQQMSNPTTNTAINVATDTASPRLKVGREVPVNHANPVFPGGSALKGEPSVNTTSGMSVGSQVVVGAMKPVDSKTLVGSYAGDHRIPAKDGVTATLDALKNAGGPRSQMAGQQNSRNYNESGKAFESTSNASDSDAGN